MRRCGWAGGPGWAGMRWPGLDPAGRSATRAGRRRTPESTTNTGRARIAECVRPTNVAAGLPVPLPWVEPWGATWRRVASPKRRAAVNHVQQTSRTAIGQGSRRRYSRHGTGGHRSDRRGPRRRANANDGEPDAASSRASARGGCGSSTASSGRISRGLSCGRYGQRSRAACWSAETTRSSRSFAAPAAWWCSSRRPIRH